MEANSKLAVGSVMTATLSVDHRAFDGAVGAELLAGVPGDGAGHLAAHADGDEPFGSDADAKRIDRAQLRERLSLLTESPLER